MHFFTVMIIVLLRRISFEDFRINGLYTDERGDIERGRVADRMGKTKNRCEAERSFDQFYSPLFRYSITTLDVEMPDKVLK